MVIGYTELIAMICLRNHQTIAFKCAISNAQSNLHWITAMWQGFLLMWGFSVLRKSRSKKYLQSTVLKRRRVIAFNHETDMFGNFLQNSPNLGVPGLVWSVLGIVILFSDLGSTSSNLFVGTKSRFKPSQATKINKWPFLYKRLFILPSPGTLGDTRLGNKFCHWALQAENECRQNWY